MDIEKSRVKGTIKQAHKVKPQLVRLQLGESQKIGRRVVVSSGLKTRNTWYQPDEEGFWREYWIRFNPAGISLDKYKQNPILLFGHDTYSYDSPIGTTNAFLADGQLLADLDFTDVTDKAKTVGNLWDTGVYNAVSMGVMPDISSAVIDRENKVITFEKSELWEISVVHIGADPDAVRRLANSANVSIASASLILEKIDSFLEVNNMSDKQTDVQDVVIQLFQNEEFMQELAVALGVDHLIKHVEELDAKAEALENSVKSVGQQVAVVTEEQGALKQRLGDTNSNLLSVSADVARLQGEPVVTQRATGKFGLPNYQRQSVAHVREPQPVTHDVQKPKLITPAQARINALVNKGKR